jgi:hypothetical protein
VGRLFTELARVENPGPAELVRFLDEVGVLLEMMLDDEALMDRLCRGDQGLQNLARQAFDADVRRGLEQMKGRLTLRDEDADAPPSRSIQGGLE